MAIILLIGDIVDDLDQLGLGGCRTRWNRFENRWFLQHCLGVVFYGLVQGRSADSSGYR